MKPVLQVGMIVLYRLNEGDVRAISKQREAYDKAGHPIGNPVSIGDVVPLVVAKVWPDEFGPGVPGVNGQALLDGNDSRWVTSAGEGDEPGTWHFRV